MMLETNECVHKVPLYRVITWCAPCGHLSISTGCALLLLSNGGGSGAVAVIQAPESTVSIFPFCKKWERDEANGLINYIKK